MYGYPVRWEWLYEGHDGENAKKEKEKKTDKRSLTQAGI
jgi:hypothetical protein